MIRRMIRPGRKPRDLASLMALYAENFRQLKLLVDEHDLSHDRYLSRVPGELPLYLEVIERHRYTTFARLTYVIDAEAGLSLDPDAHVRIYHDAEVAEVTHCYPGRINQPLFGRPVPVRDVYERRWRVNRFLDRWLEYLIHRGHGLDTLREASDDDWRRVRAAQGRRERAEAASDVSGR